MIKGKSRRIVVIKDIRSNYIEEAILILKGDQDAGVYENPRKPAGGEKNVSNDFLLKEAESIIRNYVEETARQGKAADPARKPEKIAFNPKTNLVINLALVASIVLIVYLFTRMI